MSEINHKKEEVLADIAQMLESENSFTDIAYDILFKAQEYLTMTNACLLQLNSNGTRITSIVDLKVEGGKEVLIKDRPIYKFPICSGDSIAVNIDNCAEKYKKCLEMLEVKACLSAPIVINDIHAMFLVFFDVHSVKEWNSSHLQFIEDVSKSIQRIAQNRVNNNSLLSSYEVLKQILSNIGSGLVVYNKESAEVLFENKTAQESEEIKRAVKECTEQYFDTEYMEESRPIEYFDSISGLWFEVKFSDLIWIDGSNAAICIAADITQKKKNQRKIEYQAHNDFLTGLYNRMKCENDLKDVIKKTCEDNLVGAILFIDLDDFKHINDALGHQHGDVLLKQIAAGLQRIVGLRGNCYRMGGDEFIVIVPPVIYENLDEIVKTIVQMFNNPWHLLDTDYYCTMSMGVVRFPVNGEDSNELIKKADIAMYDAKKAGKNGYIYYDEEKDIDFYKRLDIENNMRLAIASNCSEFVVYYQPVVDVETGKTASCEALVRWDSRVLGFMNPGDFIPLAEYLGLITSIGDYVLESACEQCRYWNENGYPDLHVNINLSVVQLLQKNIVESIQNILIKTKVNPENIVLEITETLAINDIDRVQVIISQLKKLKLKIALDDFGTGYSSLNYIKKLNLDLIKVDKTFIADILEDEYARAFIKLIVELSKAIDTRTCVEGVETREQYLILKELGVDYIQGYYFGRPLSVKQFEERNLIISGK